MKLKHLGHQFEMVYFSDQPLTPAGETDDPLAKFSSHPNHTLQVSNKLSFQRLTVKECAQFCLQVTKEHMFNCSSFEHVEVTRNCVLSNFSCQRGQLLFDNSRDFYQLEGEFELVVFTIRHKMQTKNQKERAEREPIFNFTEKIISFLCQCITNLLSVASVLRMDRGETKFCSRVCVFVGEGGRGGGGGGGLLKTMIDSRNV